MAEFSLNDPLTRIIGLAFVLAMGFLATILASTLYHSAVLLLVGILFLFAYTPVLICNQWKQSYDFMSEGSRYVLIQKNPKVDLTIGIRFTNIVCIVLLSTLGNS